MSEKVFIPKAPAIEIYSASITQGGTNPIVIKQALQNTTKNGNIAKQITASVRLGAGVYKLTFTGLAWSQYFTKCELTLTDGGTIGTIITSGHDIIISQVDLTGNPVDGIIDQSTFTVTAYNQIDMNT